MNSRSDDETMYENWLILFALVFARVAGLTMTAPIYGTSDVPLQVRVLLAAALALLIAPLQWHAAGVPFGSLVHLAAMLGVEAAIGACLGLGVLVLIHGMTLAGELVAQASGLGIAEMFDPTIDENVLPLLPADVSGGRDHLSVHRRTPHGDGRPARHVPDDPARQRRVSGLAGRRIHHAGEP